ncbi:MAG: LamG-like jellyroll fold domain-containing protein [Caldilineaceae bacterium]
MAYVYFNSWGNRDPFPIYAATVPTQQTQTPPIYLDRPGINATYVSPVYLNLGVTLPTYSCIIGICDIGDFVYVALQNKIIDPTDFALDILPATLDQFYARNWGKDGASKNGPANAIQGVHFDDAPDFDADGLRNSAAGGNDPDDRNADTDGDGLPDGYEIEYRALGAGYGGGNINLQSKDSDGDGLCDIFELRVGTRPDRVDTDRDGLADGVELWHPDCNSGAWSGGWLYTYTVTETLTVRVSSNPLLFDGDGDGMSDRLEKRLHESNPARYPFHPNVYNLSPVGMYFTTDDRDDVLLPGASLTYTTTVFNNSGAALWAQGVVTNSFPSALGGQQSVNSFNLSTNGSDAHSRRLTAAGNSQIVQIENQLTAALLSSQQATAGNIPDFDINEAYPIAIDNDRPSSTLTSGHYVQADGYRVIGGTATDPTSYVAFVDVKIDGQTDWTRASGNEAWAYTWAVPAGEGRYTIRSRATDAVAWAESPDRTTQVIVDGKAPKLTTGQTGTPILPVKRDESYRWSVALDGTAVDPTIGGDPGSGPKRVEVLIEPRSTGWQRATLNGNNWSIAYPLSPIDQDGQSAFDITGQYTVSVRAADQVENMTASADYLRYQVRIDNTAPTAQLDSLRQTSEQGNTITVEMATTITQTQWLTGSISDPGEFSAGIAGLAIAFTPAELIDSLDDPDLLLYLNEPVGISTYRDASGNQHDSSCSDNRCPLNDTDGIFGGAVQFDGTNDLITATVPLSATDLSISLWFNSGNGNGGLFSAVDTNLNSTNLTSGVYDRSLYLTNGNLCAFVKDAINDEICSGGVNYADGQWHQALLTLHLNALLPFMSTAHWPPHPARPPPDGQRPGQITLGFARDAQNGVRRLAGRLDEVAIYRSGLTAADASALYRRWQPAQLDAAGAGVAYNDLALSGAGGHRRALPDRHPRRRSVGQSQR